MTAGVRNWRWQPARGWPSPPEGWSPPPGWQPDPSWPPAPPFHVFWLETRRSRRRRITSGALVVLLMLVFGGCVAASAVDPCLFDPPPGDVTSYTITNNSSVASTLLQCDDETCLRGVNATTLNPGESTGYNVEQCTGGTLGVIEPGTMIIRGCVDEPVGEPLNATTVRVTQAHPCKGSRTTTVRARVYDPG